jgi:hypothetical protein
LEPCKDAAKYLTDESSEICIEVDAFGEGCEHADRTCAHSCGCATIQSKDGLHTYANWDHSNSVGGFPETRGFAVVELDKDTLQEVNEQFFYYASIPGTAPDITDLADYLQGIPAGRPVIVATNDEPFGEYSNYATEINAAFYSMGISPPPNNPEYRGSFSAFGVAACVETDTCPDWVTSDYQGRNGQISSSSAKICAATGQDVDVFGCFTKAGYSFCPTLDACVQNWEGGHGGPCPNVGLESSCAQYEAIGEGCEHTNKACGGCGCATVRRAELSQDTDSTGVNYDSANGYRGTALAVVNPDTLILDQSTFYSYTDIAGLTAALNAIEAGKIVSVMTSDEPFVHWRGEDQTNVNAALTTMGIPPPPTNPEYRGAFAAMGKAGCVAANNCPSWASSSYTGRSTNSAVVQHTICGGCDKKEEGKKYTSTSFYKAKAVDVDVCAARCEAEPSCYSYTYSKTTDAQLETYQQCAFLATLPTADTTSDNSDFDSGVPGCAAGTCKTLRAAGEGCEHTDRVCQSCGCATLTQTKALGQPADVRYDHSNGDRYYRGIAVIEFDPITLAMTADTFISWNRLSGSDLDTLQGKLNSIAKGTVVAIATNDEPFEFWKGSEQTNVNAALLSMGIPPPPNNPEFRGGFAGFGVAGCQADSSCPDWATSTYSGRYSLAAKATAEICPEVIEGTCQPKGAYQPNECCPAGYASITDARQCESLGTRLLTSRTFTGPSSPTVLVGDAVMLHPSGCFYPDEGSDLLFNRVNQVKKGALAGTDSVICIKQSTEAPEYEKGGLTFHSSNDDCEFTTTGSGFYQLDAEYPACAGGYKTFVTPDPDARIDDKTGRVTVKDGFCCKGVCASSLKNPYVYDQRDVICANQFASHEDLFGEHVDMCEAPAANKYCQWGASPATDNGIVSSWTDYVVKTQMSFEGNSAGITVRVQDPTDEMTQRYWIKFENDSKNAKGGEPVSLKMSYFDGATESDVAPENPSMIRPIVRFHTAPVTVKPVEEDFAKDIDEAIAQYAAPEAGYPSDRWEMGVALTGVGTAGDSNLSEEDFNSKFQACPVVRYKRNGAVLAIYKRTNRNNLADVNGYKLFTDTWSSVENAVGEDFQIYGSETDMLADTNRWLYCNYDDPGVGFPRDCGPNGNVNSRWFSMPDTPHFPPPGLTQGASFEVHAAVGCPSPVASSCARAACNGVGSTLTGQGEYCADGAGEVCCDKPSPPGNEACEVAPCWQSGTSCAADLVTDLGGWADAVVLLTDGSVASSDNLDEAQFNAKFEACPIVRYIRNGNEHAVYKRIGLSDIASINAYNLFTGTWSSLGNLINVDFELYSGIEDMRNGNNKWTFCNYDDPDIGFPRDCGPNGYIPSAWFSMPGGRTNSAGLVDGAKFQLYDGDRCPVTMNVDDSAWAGALDMAAGADQPMTEDEFNEAFWKCPVVKYKVGDEVSAVYKRTNLKNGNFKAYKYFSEKWQVKPAWANKLNKNFELYNNELDMRNGAKKWTTATVSPEGNRKFEIFDPSNDNPCPVKNEGGYCSIRNPDLGGYSNTVLCDNGVNFNIGFKISADFPVTVPGTYEFDFNVDFGWGGIIIMDGVRIGTGYYDGAIWWDGNYHRPNALDVSVELGVGMHQLMVYGAEQCCDGDSNIRIKAPGSDWLYLTEASLTAIARGADYSSRELPKLAEHTLYDLELRAADDLFKVLVNNVDVATFRHSALRSGGIGMQTWQASMEVNNIQLLTKWSSDDKLTRCTAMTAPAPSILVDSESMPLTFKEAQKVCDAFKAVGCKGFLFTTRAAQHAQTGESKASVKFCASDMLRDDAPTESDPIGWFRPVDIEG